MKGFVKKIAQYFGHDIVHLPSDPIARQWLELMQSNRIDVVFDVGANTGQFGKKVRLSNTQKLLCRGCNLAAPVMCSPNGKTALKLS